MACGHARVNEQQVPEEPEWDELDEHCLRVLARERLAAGHRADRPFGRLAVISGWHDTGVISAILRSLVAAVQIRGHVECFFNLRLCHYTPGFVAQSGECMDLNIPYCYRALKFRGSKP